MRHEMGLPMPSPADLVGGLLSFVGDALGVSSFRLGIGTTLVALGVLLVFLQLVARPVTRWVTSDPGGLAGVGRAMALAAEAGTDAVFSLGTAGLARSTDAFGRLQPLAAMGLLGHVARANAHWQELEGAGEILVVFSGPHAYVSPSWYANHPSVPTWNYAVVHAHGRARLLPPEALPGLLDRLSRAYEDARPSPWRMAGLPADYTAKMLPAIVGFEVAVERLEGKFKLSQNRRREDVDGVAAALEREGQPELAALMREHAPESR